MLEFLRQHWIDVLSLLAAIGAVVAAMYANHRVNVIHQQDMQEPLYADMRRLLNYKCDYHSAEQRAIDCYNAVPSVSADEEEAIKRKVYRFFGEIEYKQLCRILALSSQARDIDFDIGILFDLIKESEPEKYIKLQEILVRREYMMSNSGQKDVQKFLSTIIIPFYQFNPEEPGKSYDYLELSKSLELIDRQIRDQRKSLNKEVEELLMKR